MTREQQLLQEYEKKLNEMYARANTKSKKKRILYDLFNFSAICYEHFGIEKTFDWELDEEMYKLIEDFSVPFIENTLEKKELYLDISRSVVDTFIDIQYPFYEDYCKLLYNVDSYELQELIFDFLSSYDPRVQKMYQEKLENCEVFDVSLYAKTGYSGLHYPMDGLKKSLIFCEDSASSIFSGSLLVHEIGHAYESDLMYSNGINGYGTMKEKLPYTEICSRFFEYAFLNYLKEHRMYSNDTRICLLKYYKTMLQNMYCMNLICKTKYLYVNKYGCVEINDSEISEYATSLMEKLNYYNLSSQLGEEMNYKHSFVYGLGSLFAIYLYENYKNDPNNFRKEFRNTLINYPYTDINAFEGVGVTPEILIDGKILKRVLIDV